MTVTNPFTVEAEAERYHNYRPKYHHLPFAEINKIVGHEFVNSLDVACGTGHSSEVLSNYSQVVTGIDLSEAMLSVAKRNYDMEFIKASAEDLPFSDSSFDFVNISMAFHWLNQDQFLKEATRVLKPGGYLAIDSYGFLREVSADPAETELHESIFKNHLKKASRNAAYPTKDMWESVGLSLVSDFKYDHKVNMSSDEFSNLLMTWSNYQVLSAEEKEVASQRIFHVYNIIFNNERRNLKFGGRTILLKSTKA